MDGLMDAQDDDIVEDSDLGQGTLTANSGHVTLGSRQPAHSFQEVEEAHNDDAAFKDFRIKLGNFLSDSLPAYGIPLPEGKRIKFRADDSVSVRFILVVASIEYGIQITEYQFLKVHYESTVTWKLMSDYLRCSPQFHNHPRYDHVLIRTTDKFIFAQLIYIFSSVVGDATYPLALIQPLDSPTGARRLKDKDLGFFRLRARPRASSEFIYVRSIVRGALVARDFEKPGDFLVIDLVDPDMFLRLKGI
jgi:hypothetical protein